MSSEGRRWKVGSRSDLWTPALDQIIRKHWPNYTKIHELTERTRAAIYSRGYDLGLRNYQPLKWLDHLSNYVAEQWRAGLSATQIASRMGKTRSAVLGKLYRLGLLGTRPQDQQLTERVKRRASSSPRKRGLVQGRPVLPPAAPVPPLLIPLIFTSKDQCKYIPENDGLCCGHLVVPGESWCGFHYNQVFRQDDR